jgi:hypothetical protein
LQVFVALLCAPLILLLRQPRRTTIAEEETPVEIPAQA